MVFQFYGFSDVILIIFVFGMLTNFKKRKEKENVEVWQKGLFVMYMLFHVQTQAINNSIHFFFF